MRARPGTPPRLLLVVCAVIAGAVASAWLANQRSGFIAASTSLVFGVVTAVAAGHDMLTRRLPDRLVAVAATAAIVGASGAGQPGVIAAIGGVLVVGVVAAVARAVAVGGVGGGDVKLALSVGVASGPFDAALGLAAAGVFGLLSVVATGRRVVPLGPSLWLGWWVAESFETLTAAPFRPRGVTIYTECCVASAELLQRVSHTLGGGLWQ